MGSHPNSEVSPARLAWLGYQSLAIDVTTPVTIEDKPGAQMAIIQAQGADVRYMSGENPVPGTLGLVIPNGGELIIPNRGDFLAARFLAEVGTGTLFVRFYG